MTLEPLSGFEHGTPGLGIQRLNHLAIAPLERVGDFFQGEGGCSFYIKNNYNLKYLTTEKVYKQKMFFSKNLNWEMLNKNLVT